MISIIRPLAEHMAFPKYFPAWNSLSLSSFEKKMKNERDEERKKNASLKK